ncbi:MAG: hypothetical protein M3401_03675 [Actinomycetota bacterium]|nr:hypothetical protein [Actinomycetota bacterium]
MRLSVAAPLAISMLAMGVVACGGDDKLSKADLAKKANAICKNFDKKIAAVPRPAGARNPGIAAAYYEQTRPIVDDTVSELKKLDPEDSVEKDWKTFIDKQDELVRLLEDLVQEIKSRDAKAQQTLGQINSGGADASAAAKRIGANSCASSTSTAS